MWRGLDQLTKLGKPRVGIVCMTKRPIAFDTWIEYHRTLGIRHFFIRIEDTPDLLKEHGDDVTVTRSDGDQTYMLQMNRQNDHVNDSISKCSDLDITHLLHIDDDELLYCSRGFGNFCNQLIMNNMYACLHLRNYEALASHKDVQDPFKECTHFKTDSKTFTAYANGKSIACLKHDVKANGPHYFCGSVKDLTTDDAVILHYESMTFERWREKFTNYLNNGNKELCNIGKIPFKFYCNSMDVVNSANADAYWEEHKVYDTKKDAQMINVWKS